MVLRKHVVSARPAHATPMGVLVVQDGVHLAPDGAEANQNFKLVSWWNVLDALDLAPSRSSPFQQRPLEQVGDGQQVGATPQVVLVQSALLNGDDPEHVAPLAVRDLPPRRYQRSFCNRMSSGV